MDVELATGFEMKNSSSNNPFLDDVKTDEVDENISKVATKKDKKQPNMYALAALILGVLGVILSFVDARAAIGGAIATGVAAAAALIGLMIDVKNQVKLDMPKTGGDNDFSKGFDKIGDTMSDNIKITVDFTPWFYIAIIAFLAAAFFCYKRMTAVPKR